MSDKRNDGGPAFPHGYNLKDEMLGMSLRDWLAGQALSGYLADPHVSDDNPHRLACNCYSMADEMLKAREL